MSEPTEIEDGEEEYDVAPMEPLCLGVETVAILDADLLDRDSGAVGVIAVRITPDLEIEYLDGASRVWLNASVPAGPRRKN